MRHPICEALLAPSDGTAQVSWLKAKAIKALLAKRASEGRAELHEWLIMWRSELQVRASAIAPAWLRPELPACMHAHMPVFTQNCCVPAAAAATACTSALAPAFPLTL
jgi:hypothetical protein